MWIGWVVLFGGGIYRVRLVVVYGSGDVYGGVVVYGSDEGGAPVAQQLVSRTRNSKGLNAKTNNLTR